MGVCGRVDDGVYFQGFKHKLGNCSLCRSGVDVLPGQYSSSVGISSSRPVRFPVRFPVDMLLVLLALHVPRHLQSRLVCIEARGRDHDHHDLSRTLSQLPLPTTTDLESPRCVVLVGGKEFFWSWRQMHQVRPYVYLHRVR